jgi:hypothetical protein
MINLRPGEKPFRGKSSKDDIIKYLKIAKIARIDYEQGYADIEWIEGVQVQRAFVRLPAAYSSLRGCIRGMPEVGSLVVCGWYRGQTHNWEDPIILSYIDTNLDVLNDYRLLRTNKTPDTLSEINEIRQKIGYNVIRGKRRKIYPGEIQVESTQGAELYLDEDVYLSNSKLNEIEIRSADQSIRISTNQIYSISQAARTWQGMIVREPTSSFVFQPTVLPNGQKIQIVTDSRNPVHLGGKAYTEQRIELFEKTDGVLKVSEINSGIDISDQTPFITLVLGTLVGNDSKDSDKYAKVLRPQIYGSATAVDSSLDSLECKPEEYDYLASCFSLHFNKSRAQIDIDKEGHLFTFFPSSSNRHSLGAGRSWESFFEGSVKAVIGQESTNHNSLILDTKGSIQASLGFDKNGRSAFVVAQKGVHLEVMNAADDGTAYFIKTNGNYQGYVNGDYTMNVSGNYNIVVKGKINEQILGVKEENYINDKNNVYGGFLKSIIIKGEQVTLGYNRAVTITGNKETGIGLFVPTVIDSLYQFADELDITTGGQRTTLLIGGHILQEIKAIGNMKRIILSGDPADILPAGANGFLDQITTGNHKIAVTAGNVKRIITTGNVADADTDVAGESVNGFLDKITTGNHKIDIATGDIFRHVTLKNTVGIGDTVDTGDITRTTTIAGDIKDTTIITGDIKHTTTTGDIIEETVTKGDIKRTTDVSGDIVDTTTVQGDIKHNTKTGNIGDTIFAGDRTITITTGKFTITITQGDITISTLGNIEISTTLGSSIKLDQAGSIQIKPAPVGSISMGNTPITPCNDFPACPLLGPHFIGTALPGNQIMIP